MNNPLNLPAPTTDEIMSYFELESRVTSAVLFARDALAANWHKTGDWDQRVLAEGYLDSVELKTMNDEPTVEATVSYFTCGEDNRVSFTVPVRELAANGYDERKWDAWARHQRYLRERHEAQQKADRDTEQARLQREHDLAELARLRAQYPDAA